VSSRRSWLIYGVAVAGYVIAFTQRSTIGVAGVAATDRFHSTAALLSTLAVVQIIVYSGLQIPVGVLLDRFGPKALMLAGAALMTLGQATVAFAPSIPLAVAGRVLVGAGDATIFISVIRLTSSWLPPARVPIWSQWVGNFGQLGQVLSAVPFAYLLHEGGWEIGFLSAAGLSALGLVLTLLVISDRPAGQPAEPRPESWAQSLRQLGEALRRPGTQLGFWAHFSSQCSGTVMTLIWGVPFLVYGLGLTPSGASAMLLLVAAGSLFGPLFGLLATRYPLRRSAIVLAVIFAIFALWTVTLAWPGTPPLWLVVVLLLGIGAGGPGSLIGFDFARTFNPRHALGSANGIVNVGGFLASFVIMYFIGVVLDVAHTALGQPMYSLDSFRLAFLVQYLVVGVGVVFLLRARRRTRRRMREEEGITVAPLWVALSRAWSRRRA